MVHSRMCEKLKGVARKKDRIYYSELARTFAIPFETEADRNKLFAELGELSTLEHDQGRPMLSAVVVRKDDSQPGQGFFNLALELGVWNGKGNKQKFFFEEIKKVHEYWSAH